jgi:hypothetical protein
MRPLEDKKSSAPKDAGAAVKITPKFLEGIRDLIMGAHSTVARGADLVQVHTNFEK